ncbi:MAG: dihydrofolate reductase [Bacteroidales bacterium]|jgi:dihydrofolate reductase|nr:dihydrofolate reductase [Bacteroidales bacterium]
MEKCLIVAVADNWAIGVRGDLPWHIPEDLKYFKKVTQGYPVIMGRTTYFSLPFRPLKGRKNIVLNLGGDPIPDVTCVYSFEEAYAAAEGAEKCFIMGGASVYRAAVNDMDTLYITHVHTTIEDADAFFPAIDMGIWEEASISETRVDEKTGYQFKFVVYKKRWRSENISEAG